MRERERQQEEIRGEQKAKCEKTTRKGLKQEGKNE